MKGTGAVLISREQAERVVKDLENCLDHPLANSMMLLFSDDPEFEKAIEGLQLGYIGPNDPTPDLPIPNFVFVGQVVTTAFAIDVDKFVEVMKDAEG